MKCATKPIWHYPRHLRHVATVPWEIKNSNYLHMCRKTQTNCILIAFNFVIHPQILIFSVSQIMSLSPYSLHRSWQTQTVLLARSTPSFCFRSFYSLPPTLSSLWRKRCSWSLHPTIGRMTGALKMQFVCIFFHICWISAENLNF